MSAADSGTSLPTRLGLPSFRWLPWHRADTDVGPVQLTHRRIYILPTPRGWAFLATLILMLVGAMNYAVSLGFLFIFLLGGVVHAALLQSYRQLRSLQVVCADEPETFAGDVANFIPVITNTDNDVPLHCRLDAGTPGQQATQLAIVAPRSTLHAQLAMPTFTRGRVALGRMTIASVYPLGLWRAWSYLHFPVAAWVYPKPELVSPALPMKSTGEADGYSHGNGNDDFTGLRRYVPGDTLRQVSWKSLARGVGLFSKEFAGGARGRCALEWDRLPRHLDIEARLSRLSSWVLAAERAKIDYTLDLPGFSSPVGNGPEHRARCLRALAEFRLERQ